MDRVRGHYFKVMLEAKDSGEGHADKKLCPDLFMLVSLFF